MIQDVRKLLSAPIVGRTYLVPTIRRQWHDTVSDWPMLGSPHEEQPGMFDWHLDYRFLTAEQEDIAHRCEIGAVDADRPPDGPLKRWRGSRASRQFTIPAAAGCGEWSRYPPVVMRHLECRRPTIAPEPLAVPWPQLAERFGQPAEPVCLPSGRFLCPHQKLDLTYWPREADGTVICPFHRLRVRVPA